MANQQSQIVSIDGVEYKVEDMTEQQQILLNHVADLDRKLNSTKFQLDQLQVGREAFFKMLKDQLTPSEESAGLTD
jgi:septal ring factor EnvC (AmiA/AmiB activator)